MLCQLLSFLYIAYRLLSFPADPTNSLFFCRCRTNSFQIEDSMLNLCRSPLTSLAPCSSRFIKACREATQIWILQLKLSLGMYVLLTVKRLNISYMLSRDDNSALRQIYLETLRLIVFFDDFSYLCPWFPSVLTGVSVHCARTTETYQMR